MPTYPPPTETNKMRRLSSVPDELKPLIDKQVGAEDERKSFDDTLKNAPQDQMRDLDLGRSISEDGVDHTKRSMSDVSQDIRSAGLNPQPKPKTPEEMKRNPEDYLKSPLAPAE